MTIGLDMEKKAAEFVAGFDEAAFAALSGVAEAAGLRAARERAFSLYRDVPMPTTRMEEWRRTDPARFPFGRMSRLPALKQAGSTAHEWDSSFDAVITVDDTSFDVRDVSGALRDGRVAVEPFSEAAVAAMTESARAEGIGKFEALNDAFWNIGLVVRVAPKAELERGILLRYRQSRANGILIPKVVVVAGEQSRATIVERMESPDGVEVMSVMSKECHIGAAAKLRIISLREWGDATFHIASDWARVERDAQIDWITLNLGGKWCKMRFGSNGAGPGASAELDGIYFADREQHLDQRTLQVHSSPHTYSRLLYKGAVKDAAYSVYQGLIVAKPGAIKVDAYQKNNNLVLNDRARADSLPGLQIDADDLKCSHGSTVGNLDENELFYLRCRGIDEGTARKLLIRGFFEDIAARIPYDFVRDEVYRVIDAKLG